MTEDKSESEVLIVEDEALLLLSLGDDLRDAGLVVHEAYNATQALHVLDEQPGIKLVFTDVDMPGGMNGLELSAVVRERWPEIEVVVTSGKAVPAVGALPESCMFLPKPYTTDAVLGVLRRALNEDGASA
jgi:two-component system, response regulator PdtaR